MTNRERVRAIFHYEPVDRIPVVAFGYWPETLQKWANEGHITQAQCDGFYDNSPADNEIMQKLGFDFNWNSGQGGNTKLFPQFTPEVLSEEPDGHRIMRDANGLIVRCKPGVASISGTIGTTLTDRAAWEREYLPRLQFCEERISQWSIDMALKHNGAPDRPQALYCGSAYGFIRDMLGVEELSYLQVDDEELYLEIIDTCAELCYRVMMRFLESGAEFDYGYFWEDICGVNGPLVNPEVFREHVAPHYRRMTDALRRHGVDIVSVDCDGWIDHLVPIWLESGVNTMFPIEVGTWNASIAPWREKYGKELRGVGGMNKNVFARDRAAIDREIERLRPLVELGGYIPCPDHRIPPDAVYSNVAYYCEKFRKVFG